MADVITYPDALAACVARFGPPSAVYASRSIGLRSAEWVAPDHAWSVALYESGGAVWLEAARVDDARARVYPIAGAGDMAPAALDAALDAADAWRRA